MWAFSICVTALNYEEEMDKLNHIFNVVVQYLDNNEDGEVDDEIMDMYCSQYRCTILVTDEHKMERDA